MNRRSTLPVLRHFALAVFILLSACGYPNVTLRKPARPAVEIAQVAVLTVMPPGARVIGNVYGWSSVPVDSRVGYDRAVRQLRARAAGIGAEALWVPPFAEVMYPRHSPYTWPDRRSGHGEENTRPTELMGRALDLL